jgi:hypothetical protein
LRGYNGTTPKSTAQVILVSDRGDPVLATWQYGLGRAVAWTSDVKGQWGSEWVRWDKFNTFVAQLTNWVMPQPADEGLQTSLTSDGAQTAIDVASLDKNSRPRDFMDTQASIIGPDSVTQTMILAQVGPGRYRGELSASQPGTYLVRITQKDASGTPIASATAGLVIPYSPEYKIKNLTGFPNLSGLAQATGGQAIDDPALAFAPIAKSATRAQPIWPALLLMAALLFPLDVAARRLRLTRQEWDKLAAWVSRLTKPGGAIAAAPRPRVLGDLFAARDRARPRVQPAADKKAPPALTAPETPRERQESPPAPSSPEEMAERLRKARDRARKSR